MIEARPELEVIDGVPELFNARVPIYSRHWNGKRGGPLRRSWSCRIPNYFFIVEATKRGIDPDQFARDYEVEFTYGSGQITVKFVRVRDSSIIHE